MNPYRHLLAATIAAILLSACGRAGDSGTPAPAADPSTPAAPVAQEAPAAANVEPALPFTVTEVSRFNSPWAMTFLPDGRLLVTEMAGTLHLYDVDKNQVHSIGGVPAVRHVAQGGLGDLAPVSRTPA